MYERQKAAVCKASCLRAWFVRGTQRGVRRACTRSSGAELLLPCDVLRSICDELRPPPQSLANEAFLSRAAARHAEPVPETVIEAKTGRIIRRGRAQKKAVFRGTKAKSNSQAEGPQDEDGVDGALIAELGEAQASGDDAALAAAIAKINAGVRCAQV